MKQFVALLVMAFLAGLVYAAYRAATGGDSDEGAQAPAAAERRAHPAAAPAPAPGRPRADANAREPAAGEPRPPAEVHAQPHSTRPRPPQPRPGPTAKEPIEEPWGEAVEGVQARLRAQSRTWMFRDAPTFHAELRNTGERTYTVRQGQDFLELQVDGRRYRWAGRSGTGTRTMAPGEKLGGMALPLMPVWQAVGRSRRLDIAPGRHTIQVAFAIHPADGGAAVIRVASNPVSVTVTEGLPGSHVPLRVAIRSDFAFVAACQAEDDVIVSNLPVTKKGQKLVSQRTEALRILAGRMIQDYTAGVRFGYAYFINPGERAVRKGEKVIWICAKGLTGEAFGVKALPDTPENRRAVQNELAGRTEGR